MSLVDPETTSRGWDPSRPDSIDCLQIVFKVAERCNINCTYCYYFNMGDETPLQRPARASLDVVDELADWLARGCAEQRIPRVKIAFHGGEPLLVGPEAFDAMCTRLAARILPVAQLAFSAQTNGTILDERWLEVFERHRVRVGVSIDGDREAHDRYRLDHKGRSTFDRTERNLIRLVEAAGGDPARLPSTISVLDPAVDYRRTYRYLRGLGVESMSFLLPDRSADEAGFRGGEEALGIGDSLYAIFESWMQEDDPSIQIRFVDDALSHFRVGQAPGPIRRPKKDVQVLIARSDGTIAIDDSYTPALAWYASAQAHRMADRTLGEVLADPIFRAIDGLERTLPTGCRDCRWRAACRGGDLENRYSADTGFDNPSIYCDSYKLFYRRMSQLLVRSGYPVEELSRRFGEPAPVQP